MSDEQLQQVKEEQPAASGNKERTQELRHRPGRSRFPEGWRHLKLVLGVFAVLLVAAAAGQISDWLTAQPPSWLQAREQIAKALAQGGPAVVLSVQLFCLLLLLFLERNKLHQGIRALREGQPCLEILLALACPLAFVQGGLVTAWFLRTGAFPASVTYLVSAGAVVVLSALAAYGEKVYKVVRPELSASGAVPPVEDNTYLEQIKLLVAQARAGKIPLEKMTDRVALVLVPVVLVLAVVAALSWLWTGYGWLRAVEVLTAVLVCGTAAVTFMALPVTVQAALSAGRRRGIWVRDAEVLARIPQVMTMIFDKTGTLTEGKPEVTGVVTFKDGSEKGIIALAAAMVQDGTDPVSRAFRAKAGADKLPLCTEVQRHGEGVVTARCFKENIRLGPRTFVQGFVYMPLPALDQAQVWQNKGQTVFYLAVGRTLYGMFAVADVLRPESRELVTTIREQGLRTVLMTGDDKRAANHMGQLAGTDQVISELLPEQKAEFVRSLQQVGEVVAMTGDWINDAPALAQADVGMAFGSKVDVLTASSADVILPRNDLRQVEVCLRLGRKTLQLARENIRLALLLNILALPWAAGAGYLSGRGALADGLLFVCMLLSLLAVGLNTLRLRAFK
jgi:cation transport ATPase